MNSAQNNKKIAKNTILLYFRMLITMGVSLYTSRVVLNSLGVIDFGIYNLVGGVVTMFSFLNGAMATGTQRFLSFELGKGDHKQLAKVFNMSVNIHIVISLVILILAETVGLWFLNAKLVLPDGRMEAANWVYQFSILTFIVSILSVPYNASIIAHERMSTYAYVSIAEVSLKLAIVFLLQIAGYDKLTLYAILVFGVSIIIRLIYGAYCRLNFVECRFRLFWDKQLFAKMINFNGWNLLGGISAVTYNQGVNILLNIFFGPIVNAARGITFQVNGAVGAFVTNFQMALNPQIVKAYSANDFTYMHRLIFQGAKYSFYLLFLVSLPVLIETKSILSLWLNVVPEYTVIFCKLILITSLIDSISGTLGTSVLASGNISKYHICVGGLQLLILPISYLFLKFGYPPETTLYISIIFSIVALFTRLLIVSPLVGLSISSFLKKVLTPLLCVVLLALIFPILIVVNFQPSILRMFAVGFGSFVSLLIAIFLVGTDAEEKSFMREKIYLFVTKMKK